MSRKWNSKVSWGSVGNVRNILLCFTRDWRPGAILIRDKTYLQSLHKHCKPNRTVGNFPFPRDSHVIRNWRMGGVHPFRNSPGKSGITGLDALSVIEINNWRRRLPLRQARHFIRNAEIACGSLSKPASRSRRSFSRASPMAYVGYLTIFY